MDQQHTHFPQGYLIPVQDLQVYPREYHQCNDVEQSDLSKVNILQRERDYYCYQMTKTEKESIRLNHLLKLKDLEVSAEAFKRNEDIREYEWKIADLRRQNRENTETMTESLEEAGKTISEQQTELVNLKSEHDKAILLLQNKADQFQQQLQERDSEILKLKEVIYSINQTGLPNLETEMRLSPTPGTSAQHLRAALKRGKKQMKK